MNDRLSNPTPSAPVRHARGRSGFTLIEVLAAMLLIALVLPAVMRAVSVSTLAASTARNRTEAAVLAESKLQEIISTGVYQTGTMSGDFSADGAPGYQWSAQLVPWNQAGVNPQDFNPQTLSELDLKVSWNARVGQNSVTVSTLVYSNPPLGPAATPVTNTSDRRGPSMGNVGGGP